MNVERRIDRIDLLDDREGTAGRLGGRPDHELHAAEPEALTAFDIDLVALPARFAMSGPFGVPIRDSSPHHPWKAALTDRHGCWPTTSSMRDHSRLVTDGGQRHLHALRDEPLDSIVVQPGETVGQHHTGGGGYGDPLAREAERVREDVLAGFVSFQRAREVYGVMFAEEVRSAELQVDMEEAKRRRQAAGAG